MAGLLKKTKRQDKTTTQQYELYVQFMETHKDIAIRKQSDKTIDHLWDRLTNILNAGIGPQRTKENWKKVFQNWRNTLRYKKRKEILRLNETGGGPEISESQLKPIEERALSGWGNLIIYGITNLEADFNNGIDSIPVLQILTYDNITTEPPVTCSSKECTTTEPAPTPSPSKECTTTEPAPTPGPSKECTITEPAPTPSPSKECTTTEPAPTPGPSKEYTTTEPAPTPSQPKSKKRKNTSGGDEFQNRILFLKEQKIKKIAEGLHDIADSINNLAEAIYETRK